MVDTGIFPVKPCLFLVDQDERELPGSRRIIRPLQSRASIVAMADELRENMGEGIYLRERLPDGSIRRLS